MPEANEAAMFGRLLDLLVSLLRFRVYDTPLHDYYWGHNDRDYRCWSCEPDGGECD